MYSGNRIEENLMGAFAKANEMGWRTFHMEMFKTLAVSHSNLHGMLEEVILQARLTKTDEHIVREIMALIIKSIWPIKPVTNNITVQVMDHLYSADTSRRVQFVADGYQCLQEKLMRPFYLQIDSFLQDISGSNHILYHSTRAIIFIFFATMHHGTQNDIDDNLNDQLASIPGIRV